MLETLRIFVAFLLLCRTLPCVAVAEDVAGESPHPNVVVIMADDMGWSDPGCFGGEIRTPNIDRLAAEGLRFTHFYNNAICGPTRASLLSGLYCQQIGHAGERWTQPRDFSRAVTFAELLRARGYHTMMVGKWQGEELPGTRGFDRFFGPQSKGMISYFDEVQPNRFYLRDQPWKFPEQGFFLTDALTDHAVRFVEEAQTLDKPFLLYAAYVAPHWPLHAREDDIASYRALYREHGWEHWRARRFERQREMGLLPAAWKLSAPPAIPPWTDDENKAWQAERMAVYAAQVTGLDRGIGKILAALEKTAAAASTVVLFFSDNGASRRGGIEPWTDFFHFPERTPVYDWRLDGRPVRAGSGPEFPPGAADTFSGYGKAWANVSNTPFRRFKQTAYEGGIVTPLVVRWPGVTQPGGITRQIGHVVDVLPTLLELAGASYPAQFEGRRLQPPEGTSLVPIFRGEERRPPERLCWSAPRNEAIREGRWKLVNAARGAPWELYDMESDGTESTDVAADHPERVAAMAKRFQAWRARVGVK